MNNITLYVIFPLIVTATTWFSRTIYKKYISEHPKLNLQIRTGPTSRKILPNNSCILTWKYECILKNVSEYIARNISISEIHQKDSFPLFDAIKDGNRILGEQSHLDKNEEIRFEISTSYLAQPNELPRYVTKDGKKVFLYGNPELRLRPNKLDEFSLLIEYHNSKGVAFYTLFKKEKQGDKNEYTQRKRPQ